MTAKSGPFHPKKSRKPARHAPKPVEERREAPREDSKRTTLANKAYADAREYQDLAENNADSVTSMGYSVCEELALVRATLLEVE